MPDPEAAGSHERRALVVYDGQCPFCIKSVGILRRLDWFGRLAFADARRPAGLPAGLASQPDRLLEEMHVVTPNERHVHRGFRAFRWLAWQLPALWPVAPLLYLPGVPALGQRLYLWVARHRFQLVPCHGGVCSSAARPHEPSRGAT